MVQGRVSILGISIAGWGGVLLTHDGYLGGSRTL